MQEFSSSIPLSKKKKTGTADAVSVFLNYFDNNDTVSQGFIWFHLF